MRTEKDFLGEKQIPADALYGIHSLRAKENFPDKNIFPVEWYKATGIVKQACYITYKSFKEAVLLKYKNQNLPFHLIDDNIIKNLILTAAELAEGKYFEHFIVPAISGGAGTSINMNINEIIANATLTKMGFKAGQYEYIDPIEHCNIFQSTNDVIPTSLKIAVMFLLEKLENSINSLRADIELIEKEHIYSLRIGYTQMQEALPSTFGKLFSTYNEALSRDWWRVSKCFERIKIVNLGGSAIGTGLTVPRFFIMENINALRSLTKLPLARSENLSDATSNLDSFVEVHSIIKSHSVNLEKMVNDLRLLSSDLLAQKEITIPQKQAGSSIMPAKVNPVIPEFVISIAHKIYSNDSLITSLCGMGCLELNAYLPLIGCSLIESLNMLIAADQTIKDNLIKGIYIASKAATDKLLHSPSITTAIVPYIGYNKATSLAKKMKDNRCNIYEANKILKLIDESKLESLLKPDNLIKLGFSIEDLL
ncbi:MAG: hypothetical protein KA792_09065 [Bacteroidales bacterium]|nr:hypothetical protein [Bacteroidales bacterium]